MEKYISELNVKLRELRKENERANCKNIAYENIFNRIDDYIREVREINKEFENEFWYKTVLLYIQNLISLKDDFDLKENLFKEFKHKQFIQNNEKWKEENKELIESVKRGDKM